MLTYRDAPGMPVDAPAFHRELVAAATHLSTGSEASYDAAVSLAIEVGMFEAAVADQCEADACMRPETIALREASVEAARATLATRAERLAPMQHAAARTADALHRVPVAALPRMLHLRVPEGFAYYGLFPELYALAALRVAREQPPVLCIGIRSIGTTLSAFAAAALQDAGCPTRSWTLRPTGHPFDRQARIGTDLAAGLLNPEPAAVLVADEGPGLSGSSFVAIVDALRRAGVPDGRIVLLPAWDADPERMVSSRARDAWRSHRKIVVSFEDGWMEGGRLARAVGARSLEDLSAGRWRRVWRTRGEMPVVQPQHERRKYLATTDGEPPRLVKFAGLGRFGEATARRARRLHDSPAASTPRLVSGFLVTDVVSGTPMTAADCSSTFLEKAAGYLAQVVSRFQAGTWADRGALVHLLDLNAQELLPNLPLPGLARLAREAEGFEPSRSVHLDARMLPHEWLETPAGYVKTDALEHHDDHFFPGPQDVAWDVAATIEEFGLDERTSGAFADSIARQTGDATLGARVPFHRAAYVAFRAAYCLIGAGALGHSPDAARLRHAAERYRNRLRVLLSQFST